MDEWREILAREVERHPRGKAGVAEMLKVSRSYISRALSTGTSAFKARPARLIRRIYDLETGVECPAEGRRVPRAECVRGLGEPPTHNPVLMRIWRACQTCPLKPLAEARHG